MTPAICDADIGILELKKTCGRLSLRSNDAPDNLKLFKV